MGVDDAWKCRGYGELVGSWSSFSCSGGLCISTGDLSAAASPTGQPRPAVRPSLTPKAELTSPAVGWLMNPNDAIVGGKVEGGNTLALEEAYAAPGTMRIIIIN